MATQDTIQTTIARTLRPTRPIHRKLIRFVTKKPLGAIGAFLIGLMVFSAMFAELVSPYGPYQQHLIDSLAPPGAQYLLGADNFGRDMLSRIIHGSRISLYVGIGSVVLGSFSGAFLGLVSGYFGGKFDSLMLRLMDIMMAFPSLVLALAIVATLGPSATNAMLAIAVTLIPREVRVIRSAALGIKQNEYITASVALGATTMRIIMRHMLPNCMAVWLVLASAELGNAILVESSLSFLGLGTPPPTPSWGSMLAGDSRRYLETAPWLSIYPGLAISAAVFGFNLFGDALRDVLDPRLRGR